MKILVGLLLWIVLIINFSPKALRQGWHRESRILAVFVSIFMSVCVIERKTHCNSFISVPGKVVFNSGGEGETCIENIEVKGNARITFRHFFLLCWYFPYFIYSCLWQNLVACLSTTTPTRFMMSKVSKKIFSVTVVVMMMMLIVFYWLIIITLGRFLLNSPVITWILIFRKLCTNMW